MYKQSLPEWPAVPGSVSGDVMKLTWDADWEAIASRIRKEASGRAA
jgi:hypothetical protein